MTKMAPSDVREAFKRRGWAPRAGGDLYFNGHGTSAHPHLHLQLSSIRSGLRPSEGGDIRIAVCMLAFSEGPRGPRGKTFIDGYGNNVARDWSTLAQAAPMSGTVRDEFAWIIDYFTSG
jgi:hypothetical protein